MNQVVSFLSMLSAEEETGGVKRMLGVCAEFERIAKVVLDKSDKESHTRRKRKNPKDDEVLPPLMPETQKTHPPESVPPSTPANLYTPGFTGDLLTPPFHPSPSNIPNGLPASTYSTPASASTTDLKQPTVIPDFMPGPGDFPNMMTDFSDMQQFGNPNPVVGSDSPSSMGMGNGNLGINVGSFEQPFVPQDLWQMPMTLEWDWADMQGGGGFQGMDEQVNGLYGGMGRENGRSPGMGGSEGSQV
jgi:hypothetical protein